MNSMSSEEGNSWKRLLFPAGMQRGLWPIEWLALAYSVLTMGFMAVLWPAMEQPAEMLVDRVLILFLTLALWGGYRLWPTRLMAFVRISAQMFLLGYWYPETYSFNSVRPNLDHVFARWDAVLFGCQPSLEFSRLCPWGWFSEAVNMGYFSYYPMILAVMVFFFLFRYGKYEKASFTVMCAFFIFYLIYIFLPVAGPQFYFWAVGTQTVENGIFPSLGTYFSMHTDMMTAPGDMSGLFYRLVRHAQEMGERPTAAFPSSHIGITFILLYLVYPENRRFFFILCPFAFLLTLATVYIQAHYLVDAVAGVLASVPVYYVSRQIYSLFFEKEKSGDE